MFYFLGRLARTTLVLGCTLLCSCEAHDVPETVNVQIDEARIGGAANLRLFTSMECKGDYITPVRSSTNVFSFTTRSLQGAFGEVTQELALCIVHDKDAQLLWSSRHGGGPASIDLSCSGSPCDEKFTY